jgi:hypothetical protein
VKKLILDRARSAGRIETTTYRRERLLRQRVVILGLKHKSGNHIEEVRAMQNPVSFQDWLFLPERHTLTGFVIVCASISGDSCMTTLKGQGWWWWWWQGSDTRVKERFWWHGRTAVAGDEPAVDELVGDEQNRIHVLKQRRLVEGLAAVARAGEEGLDGVDDASARASQALVHET